MALDNIYDKVNEAYSANNDGKVLKKFVFKSNDELDDYVTDSSYA